MLSPVAAAHCLQAQEEYEKRLRDEMDAKAAKEIEIERLVRGGSCIGCMGEWATWEHGLHGGMGYMGSMGCI